jgi:uncharacterized protein YdaU (DUF1376 family)
MNVTKRETAHWFKFMPADFLADINVGTMTGQEVGIYWLLICYCWREGALPDDLEHLASLARVSYDEFRAAWEHKVRRCFTRNDKGQWESPWVEEVRAEKAEFQAKRQKAANTRWSRERAKKGQSRPTARDPQGALSKHAHASALQEQSTRNAGAMPIQNNTEQGGAASTQPQSDVAADDRGEGVRAVLPHVTDPLPPPPPTPMMGEQSNQQLDSPADLRVTGDGVWGRGDVPRSTIRVAGERKRNRRERKRDRLSSVDALVAEAAANEEAAGDDDLQSRIGEVA